MKIAVGSDHRGLALKAEVMELLSGSGHEAHDLGAYDGNSVDYPDIARRVCLEVVRGASDYGILICGTGIGMSIAANKVDGIRAALCCNVFMAGRARQHNNANVLCMGAETSSGPREIARTFLTSEYEGGRHLARLDKISKMENC
jgi:ribose 5-phosphate isomerase B